MNAPGNVFDELYGDDPDPWGFRSRWYEIRKRDLVMSMLSKPGYVRAFEPGCSNAELSYQLARRSASLYCCDISAQAVTLARQKLSDQRHAEIARAKLPDEWPDGSFDLIVFNEIGYYLNSAELYRLVERMQQSLTTSGEIIACHWRPQIEGCDLSGEDVHDLLRNHLRLAPLAYHEEPSFIIELWSGDPRCVAAREGLTGTAS